MSLIKTIKAQLGLSVTPSSNFTLDASADNGTMKLSRNSGQDIMTVDAAGKVAFPQNVLEIVGPAGNQAYKYPDGTLIHEFVYTGALNLVTYTADTSRVNSNFTYIVPFVGLRPAVSIEFTDGVTYGWGCADYESTLTQLYWSVYSKTPPQVVSSCLVRAVSIGRWK